MRNKFRLLFLGIIIALSVGLPAPVVAAGSAVVTVELSANPVTTSSTLDLRFYVTPSGANIYSTSIAVNLTNLTYVSYASDGSPFNGYAGVPTSTSTSFEVGNSYQGASPGGTGKLYMGKVTVLASGSAGTGQITLSSAQAYDAALDPMTASSQSKSVTIAAPATPPATCPSGQTGTPPNCKTPVAATPTTPTNPTTQPNKKSTVTVPTSTSTSTAPASQVVSETKLAEVFNGETTDATKENETSKPTATKEKTTSWRTYALYAVALIALIGLALAVLKVVMYRRRLHSFNNNHVLGSSAVVSTPAPAITPTPPVVPVVPTETVIQPSVVPPSAPSTPPTDADSNATVIHPEDKG